MKLYIAIILLALGANLVLAVDLVGGLVEGLLHGLFGGTEVDVDVNVGPTGPVYCPIPEETAGCNHKA